MIRLPRRSTLIAVAAAGVLTVVAVANRRAGSGLGWGGPAPAIEDPSDTAVRVAVERLCSPDASERAAAQEYLASTDVHRVLPRYYPLLKQAYRDPAGRAHARRLIRGWGLERIDRMVEVFGGPQMVRAADGGVVPVGEPTERYPTHTELGRIPNDYDRGRESSNRDPMIETVAAMGQRIGDDLVEAIDQGDVQSSRPSQDLAAYALGRLLWGPEDPRAARLIRSGRSLVLRSLENRWPDDAAAVALDFVRRGIVTWEVVGVLTWCRERRAIDDVVNAHFSSGNVEHSEGLLGVVSPAGLDQVLRTLRTRSRRHADAEEYTGEALAVHRLSAKYGDESALRALLDLYRVADFQEEDLWMQCVSALGGMLRDEFGRGGGSYEERPVTLPLLERLLAAPETPLVYHLESRTWQVVGGTGAEERSPEDSRDGAKPPR